MYEPGDLCFRSLYIFYMQAKAYSEVQDTSLVVSIVGDVGEARALQASQQDNSGTYVLSIPHICCCLFIDSTVLGRQ